MTKAPESPKVENLPTHRQYSGPSSLQVTTPKLTLWWSYNTVVAFETNAGLVVRENEWSTTTGKHLRSIDVGDKKSRIPGPEFEAKLRKALA